MAKTGGQRAGKLSKRGSVGGKSSSATSIFSRAGKFISSLFGKKAKGAGGGRTGGQTSKRMSMGK